MLWLGVVLTILVALLLTLGVVVLIRRSRRFAAMRGTTDVEGFYVTAVAALYGIVVAFAVFVVWSRYYEAVETVHQEADALGDLYRLAAELPPPISDRLQTACLDYASYVVDVEWPRMQRNDEITRPVAVVEEMWTLINSMNPDTITDSVLRDHILSSFIQLTNLRRGRLLQSRTGLPVVIYILLIFGALITVAIASVFATDDFRSHAIKAGALATLIALLLFTIYSLHRPFQGPERVSPDAFERTLELLDGPETGALPTLTPQPLHWDHPGTHNASVSVCHHV